MNEQQQVKIVSKWLYIGVFMVLIQIVLGGITRLTGSGLSITEWKPLLGALPPTDLEDWNKAFDGYKQIAQFKLLNADFTLQEFKKIFFWEWIHREWARVMSLVFVIPLIYFILKKYIKKEMTPQFIMILIAGALQGFVGWRMVHSGLNDTNVYVAPLYLAAHFMSALVLLVVVYWYALYFSKKPQNMADYQNDSIALLSKYIFILISIAVLLVIQLTYGCFMAGLKAATFASTWPTINGDWFPPTLSKDSFISHPINVHFVHRNLAYIILLLVVLLYSLGLKHKGSVTWTKMQSWPLVWVVLQVFLGIMAVLFSPYSEPHVLGKFEWTAAIHQIVAMMLLLSIVRLIHFIYYSNKAKL